MPRDPNQKLRQLLAVANWTREGLARAVNAVASESGRVLTYDRTSVSHWLRGATPRGDTPLYIAEALSRRLGRVVTPDEAGFSHAQDRQQGWPGRPGADAFAALRRLAGTDLSSIWTGTREERIYRQADLDLPAWPGPRPTPPSTPDESAPEGLEMMTSAFRSADRRFGGGHAREALVAYLAGDVVDVAGRATPAAGRRRLCAIAAAACDLAGFMSFDSHFHGLALAYFRIAARLALEAADPDLYAGILRNISLQAWMLGDTRSANRIAELAVDAAEHGVRKDQSAELLGHVAVTLAASNRHGEAHQALGAAEDVVAATGIASATVTYQRAVVLEYAGELAAAQRALLVSVKQRDPSERRSRALTTARLAGLRLRTGQVDKACDAIRDVLDDHTRLSSARVDAALDDLGRHLARFRGLPSSDLVLLELRRRRRHAKVFTPGGGHDDTDQA
ncbi:hypothetical protein GCM10017786_24900 [Amycolatopsis deserti]|uniref:Transcriptional regulator n=1 Tax=Amycolatopsis deserti TaxID=185696 RepID=A0ABQ3IR19_9PSEU|nr:hypothetical protein [Amycolatopsis deserti]GHE91438.1 hypothetical protein GCM10017786_24900 [Amycolatopsis deserti]